MSEPAAPVSPPKTRKRWLSRLRTLVILILLIGSAAGLWWRWEPREPLEPREPWEPAFTVTAPSLDGAVPFSTDEQFLYLSNTRDILQIWDLRSHCRIFDKTIPYQYWSSPTPGWLWTGYYAGYGKGSTYLNLITGETHTFPEYSLICYFSHGSKAFVSIQGQEDRCLIELPSGRKIGTVKLDLQQSAPSVAFAPDEKTFVNFGYYTSASLFNTETLAPITKIPIDAIECFFTKDSTKFVLTNLDGVFSVYDAKTGKNLWKTHGYLDRDFSGNGLRRSGLPGRYLVLNDQLGYDHFKDTEDQFGVYEMDTGHRLFTFDGLGAISKDGRFVFAYVFPEDTKKDGIAKLFDLENNGKQTATLTEVPRYTDLFFLPDSRHIAGWPDPMRNEWTSRIIVWDVRGGPPLTSLPDSLETIEQDSCVVCGRREPVITLHDACSGQELFKLNCSVRAASVFESANSRYLMSVGPDGKSHDVVNVWERRRPTTHTGPTTHIGITSLPEFWLTVLFAGALGWSIWRDRKRVPAPNPVEQEK